MASFRGVEPGPVGGLGGSGRHRCTGLDATLGEAGVGPGVRGPGVGGPGVLLACHGAVLHMKRLIKVRKVLSIT